MPFYAPRMFEYLPDTEGILSVKCTLKEKGCKDNILLSNLDFAERTFRHSPLSKIMSLQVKGEWQCVLIGKSCDVMYTVSSEDGEGHLDGRILCRDEIHHSYINNIHFSMHSCQNEIQPCFVQAKEAAKKNIDILKVFCNKFSITYTVTFSPEKVETIKTACKFKLDSITAQGLLEKKCWMEKEKKRCRVLRAGLDHLINMYLTIPGAPKYGCTFFIEGDGETVEIVARNTSNKSSQQFILLSRDSKFSMYPPSWENIEKVEELSGSK